LEGELYFGESSSYGIEFYLRRTKGRLTGWASYTLSRVFNHFEDLNNNQKYPAFYDRPHDVSVFLSWQVSPKINLSLNWIYFTGSAITTPVGYYQYNGSTVPLYGDKNNDRLPDYHRLDFSFSWNLSNPQNSFQHSLNFGLYNLYNRLNPVSINFNKIQNEDGNFVVPANYFEAHDILSTQKYLGGFMPSVTYKFKIR
jgi:outer membrane receptor for ferrienterochelin and colicin